MTTRIFKYAFTHGAMIAVMPLQAKILHVEQMEGEVFLWAEVDPDEPNIVRPFLVLKTGDEVPKGVRHLKTFIYQNVKIVLHLYERVPYLAPLEGQAKEGVDGEAKAAQRLLSAAGGNVDPGS